MGNAELVRGKFIQDTTYQILSESSKFCRRCGKTFWLTFFLGHGVFLPVQHLIPCTMRSYCNPAFGTIQSREQAGPPTSSSPRLPNRLVRRRVVVVAVAVVRACVHLFVARTDEPRRPARRSLWRVTSRHATPTPLFAVRVPVCRTEWRLLIIPSKDRTAKNCSTQQQQQQLSWRRRAEQLQ